jgi:hypothetical protein
VKSRMVLAPLALLVLLAAVASAGAAESEFGVFSFSLSGEMKGTPEEVFDAATGDITGWWDHTMSGNPLKMYVEPVPGGAFMEIFNEQGDGVRHAVVTGAERGKLLRYEGPLGLAGFALHMVTTWAFAPAGARGGRGARRLARGHREDLAPFPVRKIAVLPGGMILPRAPDPACGIAPPSSMGFPPHFSLFWFDFRNNARSVQSN